MVLYTLHRMVINVIRRIDPKILKSPSLVKKKRPPKRICKIFFDNECIEKNNLSGIFWLSKQLFQARLHILILSLWSILPQMH